MKQAKKKKMQHTIPVLTKSKQHDALVILSILFLSLIAVSTKCYLVLLFESQK